MKRLALPYLFVLASAAAAPASLVYQFNFTETTLQLGFPVKPFSFSLTVPTFIGNSDTPPFTPFTITDAEMNSWTIVADFFGVTRSWTA
jgi:hypothetical protein